MSHHAPCCVYSTRSDPEWTPCVILCLVLEVISPFIYSENLYSTSRDLLGGACSILTLDLYHLTEMSRKCPGEECLQGVLYRNPRMNVCKNDNAHCTYGMQENARALLFTCWSFNIKKCLVRSVEFAFSMITLWSRWSVTRRATASAASSLTAWA